MPLELSDSGQRLLDDLPPYLADEPWVRSVVDSCARELDRVDGFLSDLRSSVPPQNADDDPRLLGLWELTFDLPVEPTGATVSARRDRVLAAHRSRSAGAGETWVDLVTEALGTIAWTHAENTPGDYDLLIGLPVPALDMDGNFTYGAQQLESLIDRITPAHLNVTLTFGDGFVVGLSRVGDSM